MSNAMPASRAQAAALWLSTSAFTICFAVWTIFAIIGIELKAELGLSDTQFGLLVGTPVLTGSIARPLLGIWAEQYGARRIFALTMLASAFSTYLLSMAHSYIFTLFAALGLGLAGGGFAVGVVYVTKFFPSARQGVALGIFGMGNMGAAVTKLLAPMVMLAMGWTAVAQIWAVVLALTAAAFFLIAKDEPDLIARRASGEAPRTIREQLQPLRHQQVWRFSLYYFFVFGAFVALALWLPKYLSEVYGLGLETAGILAAIFSLSASVFRAYGGMLSDKYGARKIMYATFGVSLVALFMLSYPPTDYVVHGVRGDIHFATSMGLVPFVLLTFVLGFFMSLGKAAVFKHIPVYFPKDVGAVGGMVGMVGGLGGFVLPIVFGIASDLTNIWTSCFAVLFFLVAVALAWMHFAIRQMEQKASGLDPRSLPQFPELVDVHDPAKHGMPQRVLEKWDVEDPEFWETTGEKIARRNLYISIPALFLAFAVWMVWSMVVAELPKAGFAYSTDQLFWLAALPGLSGATFRIFYSFMVPIFGGRLWTTLSTASLLIPAFGIGYAVQNPETPYIIFLVLALLCGLGGGNFASSMSNISFFFPKAKKGNAMALNAGLGNLGVSAMQFIVPIIITSGVFGILGGASVHVGDAPPLWLQNAGFIWVPFIIASSLIAWIGMHDIADAKASFAEQSVIFQRSHNWLMCWLYTGTFGSFIGFSAGLPLLAKHAFPTVDALKYVFLGPLVGALSRAFSGWMADKWGGARVTFWVFIGMIAGVVGVGHFLSVGHFWGFLGSFIFIFLVSGIGNASTFQMIPNIMGGEIARLMPELSGPARQRQAEKESAAIVGFTSAVAAYGAFFIPKSFGSSIAATGSPMAALIGFVIFYASCAALTWVIYSRPGGVLYALERQARPLASQAA